jgi:hypothetical protein
MRTSVNRRSVTLGLGAAGALIAFKGCGGGEPPSGGNGGVSVLPGSIWHMALGGNVVKIPRGGVGAPQTMGKAFDDQSFARLQVSRKSPRYLQSLYRIGGADSSESMLLQCYDHGSNQPYCYFTVPGHVSAAFVSPSGNFVSMKRGPSLVNSTAGDVVGLNIVDISDTNNIRMIRNGFQSGSSAVLQFSWLDDDQYIYMTSGGDIVTGSATAGARGDRKIGVLDNQGMHWGPVDVHPDGSSMLVTLTRVDNVNVHDIYLYKTSGEPIDRMTATGEGTAPRWSPDGRYFLFSHGYTGMGLCDGICVASCYSLFASADMRGVTTSTATRFDSNIVPCPTELFWSAIA